MNIAEMMKQAQALQAKMMEMREEAAKKTAEGSAGGGMVKVTVNGNNQVVAVKIEPDVIDPEEPEMLQDLVTAATNQALTRVQESVQAELGKLTQGMGLPPGLF